MFILRDCVLERPTFHVGAVLRISAVFADGWLKRDWRDRREQRDKQDVRDRRNPKLRKPRTSNLELSLGSPVPLFSQVSPQNWGLNTPFR
jgi:hypothetical protein